MKAVYLDDSLHRRVKLVATRKGRTLKAVVESLLERALREEVSTPDVSTEEIQALASRGGSFDLWQDEQENLYSIEDGEPIE